MISIIEFRALLNENETTDAFNFNENDTADVNEQQCRVVPSPRSLEQLESVARFTLSCKLYTATLLCALCHASMLWFSSVFLDLLSRHLAVNAVVDVLARLRVVAASATAKKKCVTRVPCRCRCV